MLEDGKNKIAFSKAVAESQVCKLKGEIKNLQNLVSERLVEILNKISSLSQNEIITEIKIFKQVLEANTVEAIKIVENIDSGLSNTHSLMEKYYETSTVDQLTGVFNRTSFDSDLDLFISEGYAFHLIVLDLNDLKLLNDNFSHTIGDDSIKEFAKNINLVFGIDKNRTYRFGGDEFGIISFDELSLTQDKLEKLRTFFKRRDFTFNFNGRPVAISLSFAAGLTTFEKLDTKEGIFDRADKAMYENKRTIKKNNENSKISLSNVQNLKFFSM